MPNVPAAFFVLSLALPRPCNAASSGFEYTGSLGTARENHTATLLQNGKVLVAGGDGGGAEIYDPASGTWTETDSLTLGRYGHTATLLPNSKVLVVGGDYIDTGYGGFTLATAELYDPASGMWTTTGGFATSRSSHTATLLPNGKVLVVVGTNSQRGSSPEDLTSAELYDPATGTWTATGNLAAARAFHTATLLADDKVLVAGGMTLDGNHLVSAEVYDPASGTWAATGSLATSRANHTATLLPGGKVLVAGGNNINSSGGGSLASAEVFDPSTETWAATGSLRTGRSLHTATLLKNGTVLIAAGDNAGSRLASAELYGKPTPPLLNISTRARVQTGEKVLIAGFIITGKAQKTLLVRGIGPSLLAPGVLADPVIEVHGPSGELLGINDNWQDAATKQQISESGLAPKNELESALWGILNPGAYTVVLSGKDGKTGVGSVEVYDLDQTVDSELANISTRGFVDTGDNVMIGGLIVGAGNSRGTCKVIARAPGSVCSRDRRPGQSNARAPRRKRKRHRVQ